MEKNVLLIAGGGTLGTYVSEELLNLGCSVDVICPEEKHCQNEKLCFYREYVSEELLLRLFEKKHYDGIVNFIHYTDVEEYKPMHRLLTKHTDHLIFLSSYRVYADLQHPITEEAPMLLDVAKDEDFLAKEDYALAKARCEAFIRSEKEFTNWTIVRPVISFSKNRLDVVTRSGQEVVEKAKKGECMYLPEGAKHLMAGLDWAGNTGKLIANLLFKPDTLGEAYTIYSGQNLTWGEIAELYTELLGVKFEWIDTQEYIEKYQEPSNIWTLIYDRLYDRRIDNRKVLNATGLEKSDFASIKEGIEKELKLINGI